MEKIRIWDEKVSDPGWKKIRSGIRDGKNSDPGIGMEKFGSGIRIRNTAADYSVAVDV
jgi:hypothetical protein